MSDLSKQDLLELLEEMGEYLDKGHGTSIGCGSIFHQQIKSAVANDKHHWKLDGPAGMFDDNYICTKCGLQDSESIDASYTKPEFGCPGVLKKITE